MPLGEAAEFLPFNGTLLVEKTELLGRMAGGKPRYGFGFLPEMKIQFVSDENTLIPVEPGYQKTGDSHWAVIVGPGKIWAEQADRRYSRRFVSFYSRRPI